MADTTSDLRLTYRGIPTLRSFTVAAANTIPVGAFVTLNSSGLAINGGDDASTIFAGVSFGKAHTGGQATAGETIVVATDFEVLCTLGTGGGAAANLGLDMNVIDNQTLDDDAAATNDVKAGILTEIVTTTSGWVKLQFAGTE